MKKTLIILPFALIAALFVSQAFARGPGAGPGAGWNGCPGYNAQGPAQGSVSQENIDKFLTETQALRKQLVGDAAELDALMAGGNPDPAKVRKLSEQIYETREAIRAKAVAAGLPGNGFGPGSRGCGGYGPGGRSGGGPGACWGGNGGGRGNYGGGRGACGGSGCWR